MGEIKNTKPCLLILVAYSRYPEALVWGVEQLSKKYDFSFQSELIPFTETQYYTSTMGSDLKIQLTAFNLIQPQELAEIKIWTNELEASFKLKNTYPELRPLNLDPGYLNEHKFVLATTKDADHRLYQSKGIYAESTLHFRSGTFQEWPWTYANYRRQDHKDFLLKAREYFLNLIKNA